MLWVPLCSPPVTPPPPTLPLQSPATAPPPPRHRHNPVCGAGPQGARLRARCRIRARRLLPNRPAPGNHRDKGSTALALPTPTAANARRGAVAPRVPLGPCQIDARAPWPPAASRVPHKTACVPSTEALCASSPPTPPPPPPRHSAPRPARTALCGLRAPLPGPAVKYSQARRVGGGRAWEPPGAERSGLWPGAPGPAPIADHATPKQRRLRPPPPRHAASRGAVLSAGQLPGARSWRAS